jgi:hypothetical protein
MKARLIALATVDIGKALKAGKEVELRAVRSAPPYISKVIPGYRIVGEEQRTIAGRKVSFTAKFYEPDRLVIEAATDVDNPFDSALLKLRDTLVDECLDLARRRYNAPTDVYEEYGIYAIWDYGRLEPVVDRNKARIVCMLRSEYEEMDKDVVQAALESSTLKYSADDLVAVGWDGAVIFSDADEIPEIVNVLTLGNLELLQLRMFSRDIEGFLAKMRASLASRRPLGALRGTMKWIVDVRTNLLLEFETIKRNIDLFGDWYTAKLYGLVTQKFHTAERFAEIEKKLDTVEDIYEMVYERLNSRYMFFLETGVSLLVVIEIVFALLGLL